MSDHTEKRSGELINGTWEKAIKFWPAIVFLAGAYVGFAKLQWQSTYTEKRITELEKEVKEHHDRFVKWDGMREREHGRNR